MHSSKAGAFNLPCLKLLKKAAVFYYYLFSSH